jgi:hypothetical protein
MPDFKGQLLEHTEREEKLIRRLGGVRLSFNGHIYRERLRAESLDRPGAFSTPSLP